MSVHSLITAPVNVYSKTYWTGFVQAVNEEAAYELGLHDQINPEVIRKATSRGWKASLFTPNILHHTDSYSFFSDRSTHIDLSSHTIYADPSLSRPLTEEEQKIKKKQKDEDSLNKYKFIGPLIGAIGGFLSAYTWSGYQRCKATYDHTHQVQSDLNSKLVDLMTPLKPTLKRLVAIKLKVDEIRFKILYRYFLASAGILVGGGLLTLGAYAKEPKLIPWGGVALAVSAIWGAISAGFHRQDNKDIRNLYTVVALDPECLADHILWNLEWYQEGMILLPQYVQNPVDFAPPPYQPFIHTQVNINIPPPTFVPDYQANIAYPNAPSAPYLYPVLS